MEIEEIIAYALTKKILIDKDAAGILSKREDGYNIIDALEKRSVFFINRDKVNEFLAETETKTHPEEKEQEELKVEIVESRFKPFARDIESRIKIDERTDITGKSQSHGTMDDFLTYFKDKFEKQKKIILENRTPNLIELAKIPRVSRNKIIDVIGMVYEKNETKNGHIILEIDDPTGKAKVLILKDRTNLINISKYIMEDDVLQFNATVGKDLLVANEIKFPDMPIRAPRTISEDIKFVATSDLHLGHKKFLDSGFDKFLEWLNGKTGSERQKELAGKVKYLLIGGDCVDGIGVYPGQEEELVLKDIYKQYELFEDLVMKIPEYIQILIGPGNHDAVRIEDPQPRINEKYLSRLAQLNNVHLISSPSNFSIHGINVTFYHGYSMDPMISSLPHLSYSKPEDVMVEYLRRRHVVPRYGSTERARALMFPEREDILSIQTPPDILVAGHLHKNGYTSYRSTLVVNPGCWQKRTEFQIKMGHMPTPGIVPVIGLNDLGIKEMKFMTGESI
ncbi:MAG: metallophosphoesterase [Candidatus Diapherotrites archaeon]|nr:metallophosphoesterase [Candidatus Diapherotrites archaeon]